MGLFESLDVTARHLPDSARALRVANLLCLAGAALAILSAWAHRAEALAARARRAVAGDDAAGEAAGPRASLAQRGPTRASLAQRGPIVALIAAVAVTTASVLFRYREVHHFPSQTMSEVLVMFGYALLVSMTVLHFALRWREHGPGWAIVGDATLLLVFLGAFLVNHYAASLPTAQRDLPPALQSWWFAPHLAALIFSYATLGVAGAIATVYFCIRFWSVLRHGGRSVGSQVAILAVLVLVPFAQVVTIPVLFVTGLVALTVARDALPRGPDLLLLERKLDEISHRAFAVGFPFLTAGLFMGAFWAQEAWANYWGWDSKENSALITWLVYVGYIHTRQLLGYRGERAMAVLMAGALSVFLTFQVFGYLPDSQKSLHRYTDDGVVPTEGRQGAATDSAQARLDTEEDDR